MRRITKTLPVAAVLSSAAMLAGCADVYWDRRDTVAFQSGNSNAANKVVHVIDPWPRAAANRRMEADGERMQRAVERYRTNKTTPLSTTSTTTIVSSGDSK
ncbi:MAG TPA: pilus assembly protein [Xanthobacteraceae bacterium]|nr:pilus assembly protein [Xanthobacteraceae bacterium]